MRLDVQHETASYVLCRLLHAVQQIVVAERLYAASWTAACGAASAHRFTVGLTSWCLAETAEQCHGITALPA